MAGDTVPIGDVGRDVADGEGVVTGKAIVVKAIVSAIERCVENGDGGQPLLNVLPLIEFRLEEAVAAARQASCQCCSNQCMDEDFLHCYSS